ncbi:MAG TPA: ABC transporter ATP-binding protein [Kofleriaceae bacterium]|nr:ABC transporter ATP-binding protein [Kofleriaceae bacterium]
MDAAVNIVDVRKHFGQNKALDGVSFEIPRGGVFGLLGPNGAGKTTLFSIIAGFLKPTGGRIEVLDIDVEQISALRGRLSILPQDAQFAANVPILEQIVFFAQLSGRTRAEAEVDAEKALTIVGLAEAAKESARALSHGMYKRLGIAQAFMGNPEVILLDEPTAGLDPASAQGIRNLIEDLRVHATVIVSSHNMAEIQKMCDMVAILDRGHLVVCQSVKDITQSDRVQRMSFARPLTEPEFNAITSVHGVTNVEVEPLGPGGLAAYRVHIDPTAAARPIEQVTAEIVQKLVVTGAIPRAIEDGVALEAKFLEVTTAPIQGRPSS